METLIIDKSIKKVNEIKNYLANLESYHVPEIEDNFYYFFITNLIFGKDCEIEDESISINIEDEKYSISKELLFKKMGENDYNELLRIIEFHKKAKIEAKKKAEEEEKLRIEQEMLEEKRKKEEQERIQKEQELEKIRLAEELKKQEEEKKTKKEREEKDGEMYNAILDSQKNTSASIVYRNEDMSLRFEPVADEPYNIDDLIYEKHCIICAKEKDSLEQIRFTIYVYPLSYTHFADIIAVLHSEDGMNRMFASCSNNGRRSATIEQDGYKFMINGKWENGNFISTVTNENEFVILEDSIKSFNNNKKFPNYLGLRSSLISHKKYFIPVSNHNDNTGFCDFAMLDFTNKNLTIEICDYKKTISTMAKEGRYISFKMYLTGDSINLYTE